MQVQSNKLDFKGQNIYVGLDVHKKQWKATIMLDDLALKTFSQPPDPDTLYKYLKKNFPGGNYYTAYEAGFCGFWPHKRLEKLGIHSMVVNPADIPTTDKEKRQKEDKRDSRKIAKGLRSGDIKAIYIPSDKTLEDRLLLRTRFTLVKDLNRNKNRIKSLLHFYGIKLPERFFSPQSHWSKSFMIWLESIEFKEESAAKSMSLRINQCKQLRQGLLEITREIRKLSKTEAYRKRMKLLTNIKGIGLIIAMVILTELETITRFKKLDRLCAYIGIIPTTNSSGDNENTGDITPRRHRLLRTLLVEASWVAIRNDPALTMCYANLTKRMEPNKAIIRIAKKLLNRIRYVLKNEEEYTIAKLR
jgi:transposase